LEIGAAIGIRARDLCLTKATLYQAELSRRKVPPEVTGFIHSDVNELRFCAALQMAKGGHVRGRDDMVKFTVKEEVFLKSNELCRFATASKDGKPQVTPVVYALDGTGFVIAVDYGTKKLKNVRQNPNVALVVDRVGPIKAVIVEGTCEVHERGTEYLRLLGLLMAKFESYRKDPWGEGESPILRITPTRAVSWGLG
jgi:PPOX class probable F420-dependent enzyme